MIIDEIKKTLNFEMGAKLSSFSISKKAETTLIKKTNLDRNSLNALIDILSENIITTEIRYYLNSDQLLLDIPLTENFLITFTNESNPDNYYDYTESKIQAYYLIRDLIYGDRTMPHFVRLHAHVHNLSDDEISAQEKLSSHTIDLDSYDKKGHAIGAAIYLEAIATKASEKSLKEPKALKTWEKRIRKKQQNGNSYKPDFFDHIEHLQENRIFSREICQALHKLRKVRNAAAHNFEIIKTDNKTSSNEYIKVTQVDKKFINSASDFVSSCRELYGPVPKAFGKNIFKRYTELLAGDMNRFAKVQSVITLRPERSKKLEEIFG